MNSLRGHGNGHKYCAEDVETVHLVAVTVYMSLSSCREAKDLIGWSNSPYFRDSGLEAVCSGAIECLG